jgi:hypothetical protein
MARDLVLQTLIDRHTLRKIAKVCRVSRGAVAQWDRIPPRHAVALSRALGVPRWVLRPDLWEPPAVMWETPPGPDPALEGAAA